MSLQQGARREFTHYLGDDVGGALASAFEFQSNVGEGIVKAGMQTVVGIEQLDPTRFASDPDGAAAAWGGVLDTLKYASPSGIAMDPMGAFEHGKDMLGGITHAEDWRADRPGLGLGGVLFEAGSAATGVGAAKTGLRGVSAAAEAGEEGAAVRAAAGAAESTAPIAGRVSEIASKLDDLTTLADDIPSGATPGAHGPSVPPSLTEPNLPHVPEAPRLPETPAPHGVPEPTGPRDAPEAPAPRTSEVPPQHAPDASARRPADVPAHNGPEPGVTRAQESVTSSPATSAPEGSRPSVWASQTPEPSLTTLESPPPGANHVAAQSTPQPQLESPYQPSDTHLGSAGHTSNGAEAPHESTRRPDTLPTSSQGSIHQSGGSAVGQAEHRADGVSDTTSDDQARGHEDGHRTQDDLQHSPLGNQHQDPIHSDTPSGDGWHRLEDGTSDPRYGEPLDNYWESDGYPERGEANGGTFDLIERPDEPYGHSEQGVPLTKDEYDSRYNSFGDQGQHFHNYPPNDGALPGTRVMYESGDAYLRDFGDRFDRIGGDNGKYLGVMPDGVAPTFEMRSLPVESLLAEYSSFRLAHLPEGWTVEVSEIAPAFGRDGGGLQVLIYDDVGEVLRVKELLENGVLERWP